MLHAAQHPLPPSQTASYYSSCQALSRPWPIYPSIMRRDACLGRPLTDVSIHSQAHSHVLDRILFLQLLCFPPPIFPWLAACVGVPSHSFTTFGRPGDAFSFVSSLSFPRRLRLIQPSTKSQKKNACAVQTGVEALLSARNHGQRSPSIGHGTPLQRLDARRTGPFSTTTTTPPRDDGDARPTTICPCENQSSLTLSRHFTASSSPASIRSRNNDSHERLTTSSDPPAARTAPRGPGADGDRRNKPQPCL